MIPLPPVSTKDRSLIIQLVVAVVHPDAKLFHSRTFLYTHTFISRLAFNNRITGMDICSSLAHEKLRRRTVKARDFYLLFPVFTFFSHFLTFFSLPRSNFRRRLSHFVDFCSVSFPWN